MLAISIRFFYAIRGYNSDTMVVIISVLSVISMFAGNLLALNQTNFKRLLAYSSISHLGYLMITLLTGTDLGTQAAVFYMISYMITTVGAFGIISLLSVCECEAENTEDLKGLFWKNPWIAIVLSLTLLSLAGIPLTAGFIAKFYVVLAGIRTGMWLLVMSLVINSVISIYYYLRVIKVMFTESDSSVPVRLSFTGNLVLAIVVIGIVCLGIIPSFLSGILSRFSAII